MAVPTKILIFFLIAISTFYSVSADSIKGCGGFVEASSSLVRSRKGADGKLDYSHITNDSKNKLPRTFPRLILKWNRTDTTLGTKKDLRTETTTGILDPTCRLTFGDGLYQTGNMNVPPVTVQQATPQVMTSALVESLAPEKFNGKNFKHWQKRMLFYLAHPRLDKFITEEKPLIPLEMARDPHTLAIIDTWKHSDFLCRGVILGHLIRPLFGLHDKIPTAKDLWRTLELKFGKGALGVKFKPYSKYPPCYKDISFWISESFTENNFCEVVRGIAGDLVEEVKLIDSFTNKKGMTSHCYIIVFRSMERSLTDEEINDLQSKVRDEVQSKLNVELR